VQHLVNWTLWPKPNANKPKWQPPGHRKPKPSQKRASTLGRHPKLGAPVWWGTGKWGPDKGVSLLLINNNSICGHTSRHSPTGHMQLVQDGSGNGSGTGDLPLGLGLVARVVNQAPNCKTANTFPRNEFECSSGDLRSGHPWSNMPPDPFHPLCSPPQRR